MIKNQLLTLYFHKKLIISSNHDFFKKLILYLQKKLIISSNHDFFEKFVFGDSLYNFRH